MGGGKEKETALVAHKCFQLDVHSDTTFVEGVDTFARYWGREGNFTLL